MNFDAILNSIITATSILIAVGFPFIIFIATNYKNRKERLLFEMKSYYPRLNAFRKLIFYISTAGIVTNYARQVQKAKTEKQKNEIKENDAFQFYKAIDYISEKYSKDIINESIHNRIFDFKEINNYLLYANRIWYDINCRRDIVKELNISRFEQMQQYEIERIQNTILSIDMKYNVDKITIELIASVAGNIETEILNPLSYLSKKFEEPIPSLVKNLFLTLSFSLVIGVLIPLLMLHFITLKQFYISISLILAITICYVLMVVFMGRFIWKIQKE